MSFIFQNRDCMEAMAEFPDKYFELAIVDPQWGINAGDDFYGYEQGLRGNMKTMPRKYDKKEWDNQPPDLLYFTELKRISQNQIIWGVNHYTQYLGKGRIVWDKDNSENDYSDCELAYQSFTNGIRIFRYRWQGMLQGDMKNKEQRIHPTQKPIALYKWLLTKYAKPGDKILDTHAGSCSSVIACLDLGFDIWAYELDEDYYKDATKRIADFQAQIKMF